ncbi:hypothetical protein PIN31009_02236 [Pandoraea iniqua]|uniref:hypothetical protein n=1 Tax=Pandoraea iniqua TaxID=2508288 RepID=UPI0012408A3A|nr:hypothetical protein [Pandoraea iniqua]VVE02970.1 hypothetical protein PIN31009_02236 [Pandoraea iniqua]
MVKLAGHNKKAPETSTGIIVLENIKRNRALWLLLVTTLSVALYVLTSAMLYRFESHGLLIVKQHLVQYKAENPAFSDDALLKQYLSANNALNTPAGQFLMEALDEPFLSEHVSLVMPYGKNDLPFVKLNDNENLTSVGLELTMSSHLSGSDAAARLQLFAGFLTDTMLSQTLAGDVRRANMQALEDKQTLDNKRIENSVRRDEMTDLLARSRETAERYPDSDEMDQGQLLSTDAAASARFLSPMSQMIGIESDMATNKADAQRLKRRAAQNAIALRFYEAFNAKVKPTLTGHQLLKVYLDSLNAFFDDGELADDMTREVHNKLMQPIQRISAQSVDAPRFSAGPTTPQSPSGPPQLAVLGLVIMAGVLFATAITLLVDVVRHRRSHAADGTRDAK